MTAIDQYNIARDRETHAFDVSELGGRVRDYLNGVRHLNPVLQEVRLRSELARVIAFCPYSGAMPAWYAGRQLRFW